MVSNKRIAKVLRMGERELRVGQKNIDAAFFICNAIMNASDATNRPDYPAVRRALAIISERLGRVDYGQADYGRNHTVDTWLEAHGLITRQEHLSAAVQEYRLRWLKALIKEFESKQ